MRLSRNDRIAILIIAAVLVIVNGILYFRHDNAPTSAKGGEKAVEKQDSVVRRTVKHAPEAVKLHHFDPNTADSATFVQLGLRPNVARAIIHYRAAGGIFRQPSDFARIYTLSDSDFRRLKPYIRIKHQTAAKAESIAQKRESTAVISGQPSEKPHLSLLKKLGHTPININTADSTELQKIPGVGKYYAAKIVKYRNRLGGFISVKQLSEIRGLPQDIVRHVIIDHEPTKKMLINQLTFGQLLRHPYLNFEQVRAILDYRKNYGPISEFGDLKTYSAFADSDFIKLEPYIDFQAPL